MRKTFLTAALSAAAMVLSQQALADPVERVVPQGQDGDKYYYQVVCTNGTQGSVVVQDTEKNICAQAFSRFEGDLEADGRLRETPVEAANGDLARGKLRVDT